MGKNGRGEKKKNKRGCTSRNYCQRQLRSISFLQTAIKELQLGSCSVFDTFFSLICEREDPPRKLNLIGQTMSRFVSFVSVYVHGCMCIKLA